MFCHSFAIVGEYHDAVANPPKNDDLSLDVASEFQTIMQELIEGACEGKG